MSELNILYKTWPLQHHFQGEAEARYWDLPRPNIGTQLAYSRYLERLVLQGINRHRDLLDSMAYREAIGSWVGGFPSGDYNWKRGKFWDSLNAEENQKVLFKLWLDQVDKKLPRAEQLSDAQFESMWAERKEDPALSLWLLLEDMLTEKNPTQTQEEKAEESR